MYKTKQIHCSAPKVQDQRVTDKNKCASCLVRNNNLQFLRQYGDHLILFLLIYFDNAINCLFVFMTNSSSLCLFQFLRSNWVIKFILELQRWDGTMEDILAWQQEQRRERLAQLFLLLFNFYFHMVPSGVSMLKSIAFGTQKSYGYLKIRHTFIQIRRAISLN